MLNFNLLSTTDFTSAIVYIDCMRMDASLLFSAFSGRLEACGWNEIQVAGAMDFGSSTTASIWAPIYAGFEGLGVFLAGCSTLPRPNFAGLIIVQGRLIGVEEASSARTLSREIVLASGPSEVVACELFGPVHRILIVAVITVAAANSKSNKLISKLKKDVELRIFDVSWEFLIKG